MEIYAMAIGAALCAVLLAWGFSLVTSGERVTVDALPARTRKSKTSSDTFVLAGIADILGRPFTRIAMDLLGPRRARIRRRIDAAGRPGGMTVESYARQTAGYVVLFGTVGILMLTSGYTFLGALVLLGALQNEAILYARARARQDEIQRSMPDFLDVLAVTVSAGLGFRHALARVSDSMPGALAEEFRVALRQMELGTPRREAFDDLRKRNDSEAVSQFVTAILQAEELGAPLSSALIDIATDMRRESAQWAKRKAQRTTPKITVVTTALTLPALMALVIGAMLFGTGAGLSGLFSG